MGSQGVDELELAPGGLAEVTRRQSGSIIAR